MATSQLVSKVTRFFGSVEADDSHYECQGCGQGYELEYYSCPDCGSYRVERTEWITG